GDDACAHDSLRFAATQDDFARFGEIPGTRLVETTPELLFLADRCAVREALFVDTGDLHLVVGCGQVPVTVEQESGIAGMSVGATAPRQADSEATFDRWRADEDDRVGCVAPREIVPGSAWEMIDVSDEVPFATGGASRIGHKHSWF